MTAGIEMGAATGGGPALLDLQELLATRLLVQGNSGSGKSHLLRRLLEQSAPMVQQAVIDPEGDFVTLAEEFGHVVVNAAENESELYRIAARVRQHRVSIVLNLEDLDADAQMRAAGSFLGGLFDAPRDQWYPMLVVVDEAQLFAPAVAGEVSDEARRVSLGAMTDLMCRGRKRGLAGVIATQRLAKLAKNVAAEASNFLMGRTFLDIDMARAADLLGMDRRQAEMFRDLERGHFVALGPALSKRPLPLRIGTVVTSSNSTSPVLAPMPEQAADPRDLIMTKAEGEPTELPPRARPARPRVQPDDVLVQLANYRPAPAPEPDAPALSPEEREEAIAAMMREIVAETDGSTATTATLYQDFTLRCRARRILDLPGLAEFRRRLAFARAGVEPELEDSPDWQAAVAATAGLPEDLHGVFLLLARTAIQGGACPSDDELAQAYGTRSTGRARRMLGYLEERGVLVCRTDIRGGRIIALPTLGLETQPGSTGAMGLSVRIRGAR
jgi:hypothetical protein